MYDYRNAEVNDILDYIDTEINLKDWKSDEALQEYLYDVLWDEDTVTGNQTGYTTEEECQEWVGENFKLACEAMYEFGSTFKNVPDENPCTWMDTTIRCYLLSECIEKAIKTIRKKYKIKYKLTYEWEEDEASILDYMKSNECTFEEAIENLKEWNREQLADRIDTRAANILNNYTSTFNYKVVQE